MYRSIPIEADEDLRAQIVSIYGSLEALVLPNGTDLNTIPADPKNPITKEKVALGQLLFHETAMGLDAKLEMGLNTYSCASCHHAQAGFQSGLKQGIGDGGIGFGSFGQTRAMNPFYEEADLDVQPIRSPTILNTAYQDVMLWNGQFGATKTNAGTEASWTPGTPKESNNLGFEGLEIQAIAGMGVHRLKCDPKMVIGSEYQPLFDAAYPDIPIEERYTDLYAALAIAAYERTVMASEAPFQLWLKGNAQSMSPDETQGALLFFGKGECYTCHSGPGLNGMDFHALGMKDFVTEEVHGIVDEATKKGRGGFTNNPLDDYAYKTPTLYNLRDVSFLGHGGSFSTVEEIIRYKNIAIPENPDVPRNKLSSLFRPLGLDDQEIHQLTLFVANSLYDNDLQRFVPESLPSGNCFPVADYLSKQELGCD